jgi:outer membrane protein X
MKHLSITIVTAALLIFASATASAQKGTATLGGNLALTFDKSDFYFGIAPKGQYYLSDHFRGEAAVTFLLPKNTLMYLDMGVNLHYLFEITEQASFYPILGASLYALSEESHKDLAVWPTLAFGGGIELEFATRWVLSGELKYKIASDTSCSYGMLTAGLAYKF